MGPNTYEPFRMLDEDFMHELTKGNLRHILSYWRKHKKTFLVEIRNNFLNLYFLGHGIDVKGSKETGYYLSASTTFNPAPKLKDMRIKVATRRKSKRWQICLRDVRRYSQFSKIMNAIVCEIILHKEGDISEGVSEVNHFIGNKAAAKNGVTVIDRQVVYPGIQASRIDLLGLKKHYSGKHIFVVIELKNKTNKDIGSVFSQTDRYIGILRENYVHFKKTYEKVISQKFHLGLLRRFRCDIASADEGIDNVEGLVVLDNYNIKSRLLKKAVDDWAHTPNKNKIRLFLKSNVFDDSLLWNYEETRDFIESRLR